jgi:hypothetical protein
MVVGAERVARAIGLSRLLVRVRARRRAKHDGTSD